MSIRRSMVAALAAFSLLVAGLASSATALATETLEAPAKPTVTGITGTTATLHGELNPGAGAAASEYHFLYTPGTAATACEGAAAPEPAGIGAGNHHAVAPQEITGLAPNTEYAFCLQAFNAIPETLSSAVNTFKTEAVAPSVSFQGASSVAPFEARLEAVVNPNNDETTTEYKYATNEALTENAVTVAGPEINGGEQGTGEEVAGLTAGTTYYFTVIAKNSAGETEGTPVATFTTPAVEAPIVEGETSSNVTASSATVEGQVNPNNQETTYELEYGSGATPFASPTKVAGPEPFPRAILGNQPVSFSLSGLQAETVYSYRIVATNKNGEKTTGPGQTFHTQAGPHAVVGASSFLAQNSAIVSGTVNPEGTVTTYHFVYGTTAAYGLSTGVVNVGSEFAELPESERLGELQPGTTYHYAIVASNIYGTTTSADRTFTTAPPTPPTASTGGASGVGHESATVSGTVEPNGLSTSYEFQLGTEAGVYSTEGQGGVGGSGAQEVSAGLGSLAPGVTYHYRIVATNVDGTSYGQDQTFTTAGYPNPLSVPVSPPLITGVPTTIPTTETKTTTKPPAKKPAKKPKKHKKKKKKKKKKK